jgi:perosamine synthetase
MSSEPCSAESSGFIPLFVPEIRGNEWKYIKECLDTNWVSSAGSYVDRFQRVVADFVGTKYAVTTVNGTAALHIALLVAGIQPNDEVLVSTLTFIAPANAIRYVGAWPVFMDTDPQYWEMDTQKCVDFLTRECKWQDGALFNKSTGRRVKAILPVHILGHPVDLDPILEVAQKYNLVVIEDASQSLGAKYKERMVGHLGDIACFSFNGNKIVTTGGGGMIVTDNEKWARKAKYLTTQARDDVLEYVHNEIGYNYRMTNVQAAMGCAQMEQLADYIAAKRRIASDYTKALDSIPGITPMRVAPWAFSTFWMFTILVDKAACGMSCRDLMKRLREEGIESRPLWQPNHRSQAHSQALAYRCEVAEQVYQNALWLPCSVGLSATDQDRVIRMTRQYIQETCRSQSNAHEGGKECLRYWANSRAYW